MRKLILNLEELLFVRKICIGYKHLARMLQSLYNALLNFADIVHFLVLRYVF